MLAKMSENDFETRQMCRSPQCVCPSTIWDQSRGLMNNELEKGKEILQQMQSRRCFSYNKIFKADLSQTSPDSKNRRRSLRRCQFSLLLLSRYYFSQQYLFCTIFWKVFGTLCVLLYSGTMSPAMHFGVVSDSCELLFLQILLVCNLMYIRRQTEMCCAHVLNMLKLTDHGTDAILCTQYPSRCIGMGLCIPACTWKNI